MTTETLHTDGTADGFIRVAEATELQDNTPKAVRVEGRSIALFRHNGQVYATDNQCPHMGYPLTRGRVRNGVLTCDWHGWSYDMRGGGCFTGGCDDLDTFPVEERDGAIFVSVAQGGSKRDDAHYLLLQEGLLSGDNWTLSKAVAILLARGVSETDALQQLVGHMGLNMPQRNANQGGRQLGFFVNGIQVAGRYEPEDRLIPLMMAAQGASGQIHDRAPVQPLPPPVDFAKIGDWIRMFADDRQWEGIEKCIVTARRIGNHDNEIMPLLLDCAVEPYFIGHSNNLLHLVYLAELLNRFGWADAETLVAHLSAKLLGQGRGAPDDLRREAIGLYADLANITTGAEDRVRPDAPFDEDAFSTALTSGELTTVFNAVTQSLSNGIHVDRIITTMVLTAADRMARTPVNMNPGWGSLSHELNLASAARRVYQYSGRYSTAARALYHVAWQFFEGRWLNISQRPLSAPATGSESNDSRSDVDAKSHLELLMTSIEEIQVRDIGRQTRQYLDRFSESEGVNLLHALGDTILKDDNSWNLLATLRTVFDEWETCVDHPARPLLQVGLARWATDTRRRTGNQSAARTAQQFARGQTAVDLYEE